jgi:hypothetical protein
MRNFKLLLLVLVLAAIFWRSSRLYGLVDLLNQLALIFVLPFFLYGLVRKAVLSVRFKRYVLVLTIPFFAARVGHGFDTYRAVQFCEGLLANLQTHFSVHGNYPKSVDGVNFEADKVDNFWGQKITETPTVFYRPKEDSFCFWIQDKALDGFVPWRPSMLEFCSSKGNWERVYDPVRGF